MNRTHHRILATIGAASVCAATLGMGGAAFAAPGDYVNTETGKTSTYTKINSAQEDETTWTVARDEAAALSAPSNCVSHLAVITSQAETNYIEAAIGFANNTWLGAKRSDATDAGTTAGGEKAVGAFEWITGESFSYTNWFPGEPNNFEPGEPFLQLFRDFVWNDIYANNVGPALVETECTPQGLQVTKVDPNTGSAAGGNTVTVYGSGFNGAGTKTVYFGAQKATIVSVDSDFKITVIAPAYTKRLKPGASKAVDVQVKVKNKKSAKNAADLYTYTAASNNNA